MSSESHASSLSGPPSLIDVAPKNGFANGYLTDEFDEESDEDDDYTAKTGSKSRPKGTVRNILAFFFLFSPKARFYVNDTILII